MVHKWHFKTLETYSQNALKVPRKTIRKFLIGEFSFLMIILVEDNILLLQENKMRPEIM